MAEKFTFDESIVIGHFLKILFNQIKQDKEPGSLQKFITLESNPDWLPSTFFYLKDFKKYCVPWRKDKILKILKSLKEKNVVDFFCFKDRFNLMFLDHGALFKEFGYV